MTKEVFNEKAILTEPSFTTSIILPTFNEVNYLESTLNSLQQQNILLAYPDKFEFIIVDSQSTDGTFELIQQYTSNILQAHGPPGKLTARHIGIEAAKGEIIVAVDADTHYPPNWLNLMLRHFKNPSVVAVASPRLHMYPLTLKSVPVLAINDAILRCMRGSNSAFRKSAYQQVGGFNLNIDQLNLKIYLEEEVGFQRRLRKLGLTIYDWQAPIFTSNRRFPWSQDEAFLQEVRRGLRF